MYVSSLSFYLIPTVIFISAIQETMEGELVKELEVSAAASAVWGIYGSLELTKLIFELNPQSKYEVLEGDGGVGTIVQGWFPGHVYVTEKIIKIDNEKYLKEVDTVEGGLLDVGFNLNKFRFEVSEKEANSCIIKSTVEYKAYYEAIGPIIKQSEFLELVAATIGKRVCEKKDQSD